MDVSLVVLTCNRVARCMDSVWHNTLSLQRLKAETIVINNGREPVPLPDDIAGIPCRVIQMKRNLGAAARNIGIAEARGGIVIFLDDDAYIDPCLVDAMFRTFQNDPRVGAVAFRVENESGPEACLLPTVFHGCACAFRKSVLKEIGGYPEGYGYYGEEYDVAFRLARAGYRTALCGGRGKVQHMRDGKGRNKSRIIKLLIRNNCRLWASTFPERMLIPALLDTFQRYALVARKEGARAGFWLGLAQALPALVRGLSERRPLPGATFGTMTLASPVAEASRLLQSHKHRRVIICGVGKFPRLWLSALREQGIVPSEFWDTNSCWRGAKIDGIPVRHVSNSLPPVDDNTLWLTGTDSHPENERWRERLAWELGCATVFLHAAKEDDAPATSACCGSSDMAESCRISVFCRVSEGRSAPKACGMAPAQCATESKGSASKESQGTEK